MNKINKFLAKFGGLFAAFALMAGVASARDYCILIFHQPKVPQSMSKFLKKSNSTTAQVLLN